ncbi:sulfotransferase domain-containing protein [Jannaschia sp. S6380]|uniref:sulfotransferase domain-containing protein n=1 Tax=Jannaschia sp. S6380 TaxID=2926408 RepID=UPI001FF4D284|nr:sulfotransferase domain-containing protein [Jannaschia sp. S6380]MCK0168499.1 sulfotransferase domain-containing protein [Jannaschia sp. S6380]
MAGSKTQEAPGHSPSADRAPRVNVIGIGAQKCASSWLHAVAASHPDIAVADPKEVDFFSYHFDHGYRWYEGHFDHARQTPVRFESSPSYFHDPRSPARARAYNPDIRVVVLLRDPIRRAFSNHAHEIIKGHIPPIPFEDGLRNNPAYVEQGLYATHLSRWRDAFPEEQVLVLFAEEVSAGPEDAARRLFTFLGVDAGFESAILRERRNDSDRARIPALRTGLRAGGDWLRRQGMEPLLSRIKQVGPVAQLLQANRIEIREEIPPMRPETRERLSRTFAAEMEALRAMLGRDVLPWDAPGR